MNTTAKKVKPKGGATGVLDSLLGEVKLEQAAPQERIIKANPAACRMWKFADRPEDEAEHLDDIKKSIQEGGQIHPALARPCNDPSAPDIQYEIIVGKVRWLCCSALEIPIELKVREIDDLDAHQLMIAENKHRKDISEYARALNFALSLSDGLYKSKTIMAAKLELSASTLSYYLAFASLPETIVKAFGSMRDVTLAMGYRLSQAVKMMPEEEVLALIPRIKEKKLSAADLEAMVAKPSKAPIKETGVDEDSRALDESDDSSAMPIVEELSGQQGDSVVEKLKKSGVKPGDKYSVEPPPEYEITGASSLPVTPKTSSPASNPSSSVCETDLERANKLRNRIFDRISVVWVADAGTADNAVIKLSVHSGLASYLINNQAYLQELMSKLKEEAVISLEKEVPLDLFDNVEGK